MSPIPSCRPHGSSSNHREEEEEEEEVEEADDKSQPVTETSRQGVHRYFSPAVVTQM